MTQQLPSLPSAHLTRLQAITTREVVLAWLASRETAGAAAARSLKPWGVANAAAELDALMAEGLAQTAAARWQLSAQGRAQAERRYGLTTGGWPAVGERQLVALALRLDPKQPAVRSYLADARNFYACSLAVLFDLANPATHPKLGAMRAALVWRIAAARCPDLLSVEAPTEMTGPSDPLTRALYLRFCGLARGTVEQATPALLRRILPAATAGVGGLRRALVSAAVNGGTMNKAEAKTASQPVQTADDPADFGAAVAALARTLKTPKARGGAFTAGQVAIAQVYDAYTAKGNALLTLDEFKSRLWAAVRAGADFHLTRLDMPHLMDEALRKRSATPTRAGDVVHFVVVS